VLGSNAKLLNTLSPKLEDLGLEIKLERVINANKEFVFDWWTDLSPSDTALAKPLKSRKIISRSPTQVLLQDDEVILHKRMKFDVRITLARPNAWIAEYDGKVAKARSEYTLSDEGGSTKLFYHSIIEPKGFLTKLFSPIIAPFVKRVFYSEVDGFIRVLEEDYRKQLAKSGA
jgi:hypothetical protein